MLHLTKSGRAVKHRVTAKLHWRHPRSRLPSSVSFNTEAQLVALKSGMRNKVTAGYWCRSSDSIGYVFCMVTIKRKDVEPSWDAFEEKPLECEPWCAGIFYIAAFTRSVAFVWAYFHRPATMCLASFWSSLGLTFYAGKFAKLLTICDFEMSSSTTRIWGLGFFLVEFLFVIPCITLVAFVLKLGDDMLYVRHIRLHLLCV